MRLKPFCLLLFLVAPIISFSQTTFIMEFEEPSTLFGNWAYGIEKTHDGGYILLGESDKRRRFAMVKVDAAMNRQWTTKMTGYTKAIPKEIKRAVDNGFYVTVEVTKPGNDLDLGLYKFDQDGLVEWQKAMTGGTASYGDKARSLLPAMDTSVYVGGDVTDNDYAYLAHYLADGTLDWEKHMIVNNSTVHELCYSKDSSAMYAALRYGNDGLIMKLDPADGTNIWSKQLTHAHPMRLYAMVVTEDDDIIALGHLVNYTPSFDMFAVRLDGATGNLMWSKVYDDYNEIVPQTASISIDQRIYIGGYAISGSVYEIGNLIAAIDTAGNLLWAEHQGSDTTTEYVNTILAEPNGFISMGHLLAEWRVHRGDSLGNFGCNDSSFTMAESLTPISVTNGDNFTNASYSHYTSSYLQDTINTFFDSLVCSSGPICSVTANFTTLSGTVCSGDSVHLFNFSSGGPYRWLVDGSQVSTDTNYAFVASGPDTLLIELIAGDSTCNDT